MYVGGKPDPKSAMDRAVLVDPDLWLSLRCTHGFSAWSAVGGGRDLWSSPSFETLSAPPTAPQPSHQPQGRQGPAYRRVGCPIAIRAVLPVLDLVTKDPAQRLGK